uniref:Uncharacterized protein n=1 Tax=Vitis vinifera TaxID=29760 RepID=A5AZ24_VITVI|nr:hypothetical protein VITISV_008585 [Vitis vinifera]
MARIREGHTDPSLSREPRPKASSPQDSTFQAPEASNVPFSKGGVPSNPPQCRYATRRPPTSPPPKPSIRRIPPKRAKTLGPKESFRHSQPDPRVPTDSQHPSGISPEAIIKRLMMYHLERLMTPREFFYPRVAMDFYQSMTTQGTRSPIAIHFSIDGRQGILKVREIAEALYIPYELVDPAHFREWSPISQWDMDERPTESVPPAPAPPMPEATSTDPPATPPVPPVAPSTSKASITIFATEFCAMVHLFQTLTTTHNALFGQMADIRPQQDQHTTILR